MSKLHGALIYVTAMLATMSANVNAAYLFEIDIDGADDGVLTFNPGFSFGGDTTAASQSAPSTAFGANGADSIFGGNGAIEPDTYVYTHAPDATPDNLPVSPGTDLGEGNKATGLVGGGPGLYAVYATWPFTTNVSGGLTRYEAVTAGDTFTVDINQNDAASLTGIDGRGHVWVLLGELNYTSGDITVTQSVTTANSFVSQRAYGLLFERVPEPGAFSLLCAAGLGLTVRRRYS